MANELNLSVNLAYAVTDHDDDSFSLDALADFVASNPATTSKILDIGTSNEALSQDDIGNLGYFLAKNLSSTAAEIIRFGNDGLNYPFRLKPGEVGMFRIDSGTLNVVSASGTPQLKIIQLED